MPQPDQQPRPQPSPRPIISNWASYDTPFDVKLREAVSNTWVKLRNRQACCGNHGHPGC